MQQELAAYIYRDFYLHRGAVTETCLPSRSSQTYAARTSRGIRQASEHAVEPEDGVEKLHVRSRELAFLALLDAEHDQELDDIVAAVRWTMDETMEEDPRRGI